MKFWLSFHPWAYYSLEELPQDYLAFETFRPLVCNVSVGRLSILGSECTYS